MKALFIRGLSGLILSKQVVIDSVVGGTFENVAFLDCTVNNVVVHVEWHVDEIGLVHFAPDTTVLGALVVREILLNDVPVLMDRVEEIKTLADLEEYCI